MYRKFILCLLAFFVANGAQAEPELRALIVDGQNNHDWRSTTPLLRNALEDAGLFSVEVETTPPKGSNMSSFQPDWSQYDVIVSNYNGDAWPRRTRESFVKYMREGGGLVIVHAANNAFGDWPEFNEMIGLGGWGGRTPQSGPYLRYRDGKAVIEQLPGASGSHGKQHDFQVVVRDPDHPITRGMPRAWMHAKDELYDRLRGPAQNINLLATAYADPEQGGTGQHEPMIFTLTYGKGRVFHTPMGHSSHSMNCIGFIVTLQRGTEWAATGEVTQTDLPRDFPSEDSVSLKR